MLLSAEEDLKLALQKYELGSADILELLVNTKYDAAIELASLDNLIGTLDKKYE